MAIKTINGAGTFLVSNNNTVTNVTTIFIRITTSPGDWGLNNF